MHNLRRIGLTFYVRFIVPKDRWGDIGRITDTASGERREVVRTLQTRDLKDAHKRRATALELIRADLNASLVQAGLRPLDDSWAPSWQAAALAARDEIARASSEPNYGRGINDGYSDRDGKLDSMWDRVEEIEERHGPEAATAYANIASGKLLPIRSTADRWLRDIAGTVKKQTADQHERSLDLLAEFIVVRTDGDTAVVLAATGMEAIDRRRAGEFVEWLQQSKGLNPKTVASRVSGLSMLWKWAERKGMLSLNPWTGQTSGLKKKAEALKTEETDERAYSDDELVRLLRADPDHGRKWTYGAALFDLLRLGLLTGARQNELASLHRRDILQDLAGIQIRSEVAKTRNAVRRIPLHPLAQAVIRARLADLPVDDERNAPLFPELPPGGPDGKRSWLFSKRFTLFREAVLGPDKTVDFHSLRRSFSTFMAHARAEGVTQATQDIQDDLMGHKRQALSGNTYTARDLGWVRYVAAVDGMVEKGMSEEVRRALEETTGNRPALPDKVLYPSPRPAVAIPVTRATSQARPQKGHKAR